jgi:sugar phosphate permease
VPVSIESSSGAAVVARGGTTVVPFPPLRLALAVWAVAAFFYLAGFYLRVFPAVITVELMRDFRINAGALGNFSAVYFYAYILMQIPTGVLVDSWGARRLLIIGSVLAAIGTFLFGATNTFGLAAIGRGLVGGSTAVGWVVTLKLATHWLPPERFAMMSGLGLFMGNMGALVAQVPLRLLVEHIGWRAAAMSSAGIALTVGVFALAIVRNDPVERGYRSYAHTSLQSTGHLTLWELLKGFRHVFGYRNTWLIFLAQGAFVGSILAFTGLWGPPYLKARFGLPSTTAAAVCSLMIVCWAMASPAAGYLSDKIGRRKPIYLGGAIAATLGWTCLFYLPGLSLDAFVAIAAVTSGACGAVILGFAYAKESVPVLFLGTISGSTNVGNMLGPTLLQPAIGWMLDRQWAGETVNGLRVYSPGAFHAGFLLIIWWFVLACALIALTRETFCRQTA